MRVPFAAILFAGFLTAASAMLGVREIQQFDLTQGPNGGAPPLWPGVRTGTAVLLLFVHPRCGCTKATLTQLRRVLSQSGTHPSVRVYFEPEGTNDAPLWASATELPNAAVMWDAEGRIAAQFGARTSGMVEFYDARGKLRFQGGVTSARGHEGDNAASDSLLARIREPGEGQLKFPVFGCAL